MGPLALILEERFTSGDYVLWDDDERWELIDGIPYNMSPAPRVAHQRILMETVVHPISPSSATRGSLTRPGVVGRLVVEILFPTTAQKDLKIKFA